MIIKWALVLLSTTALLGAVVGLAASVTVLGADDLGSGTADVVSPVGVTLTKIQWIRKLENNEPILVKVNATFAQLSAGDDCGIGDGCTAEFAIKDVPVVLATLTVSPFELSTAGTTTITWDLLLLGQDIRGAAILGIDEFAVTVMRP